MTLPTFLNQYSLEVQKIFTALQLLIKHHLPELEENINPGWKNCSYGTGESKSEKDLLVYLAPFKDSVNLGFYRGVLLHDPEQLLKGTGKSMRHIKIKSIDAVNDKHVLALLIEAKKERLG